MQVLLGHRERRRQVGDVELLPGLGAINIPVVIRRRKWLLALTELRTGHGSPPLCGSPQSRWGSGYILLLSKSQRRAGLALYPETNASLARLGPVALTAKFLFMAAVACPSNGSVHHAESGVLMFLR